MKNHGGGTRGDLSGDGVRWRRGHVIENMQMRPPLPAAPAAAVGGGGGGGGGSGGGGGALTAAAAFSEEEEEEEEEEGKGKRKATGVRGRRSPEEKE